ncbi:hypothetical protein HZH66_003085 [Vespula vulgaris]|uniref:Uncharacterized protein n=1 Tax=Vespula vulgaris TaxID=7454 RepID=A0A834KKX1_VESVU|nr:hypothetical protein HZH66_003085 [Vespula vulgaris]
MLYRHRERDTRRRKGKNEREKRKKKSFGEPVETNAKEYSKCADCITTERRMAASSRENPTDLDIQLVGYPTREFQA